MQPRLPARLPARMRARLAASPTLVAIAKLGIVLVVAVLAGVAATLLSAVVGHEVLVLRYGENLATIYDTLPMLLAVRAGGVAGIATSLIVVAVGCRRLVLPSRR